MRTRRVYAFLYFIFRKQRKSFLTRSVKPQTFFFLKLIPNFNGKRRKMQHWLLKINLHPCLWAYFAVNGSYDANRLTESVKKQIQGCCCDIYRHCDSYEDRNENMTYLASQLTKWHNQKRAVIFFQTRETCRHKTCLCYILCLRRSQSFVPSVTLGPARRLLYPWPAALLMGTRSNRAS